MKYLFVTVLFSFVITLSAQDGKVDLSPYKKEIFKGKESGSLNYRILYPLDFDKTKKYPLVLFLHGAGERGDDNESQLIHGGKLFLDSIEKYPAIVVFPQCPSESSWANITVTEGDGDSRNFTFLTNTEATEPLSLVMELLEDLLARDYIAASRLYLSGLSMGGFGTFELMWRIPEKIACSLPICGGGAADKAIEMKDIPTWIFHGTADRIVHPRYSLSMVRAIQNTGGRAKISLYPEVNHNSWDRAFGEPEYLNWMFSKSK